MKFVVLGIEEDGYDRVFPVIFCQQLVHADMAELTKRALFLTYRKEAKILLAGFCWIDNNQWRAEYGSESLHLPKNKELDEAAAAILNMPEALQGIIHTR